MHLNARFPGDALNSQEYRDCFKVYFYFIADLINYLINYFIAVILSFIMANFDGTIYLVIGLRETVDGGHR